MQVMKTQCTVALLIGPYCSRERALPESRPCKRRRFSVQFGPNDIPTHLPVFIDSRKRRTFYRNEGIENKTYVQCEICLVKERNCFLKYHCDL